MSKDTFYFSHDGNARNDEKILMLRMEHGPAGYGLYWILVEMMFESSDTSLSHDKVKAIAFANNTDIALLESVIATCITEKLFVSDGEKFWSESLRIRKNKFVESREELRKKRSEAGKKGMEARWGKKEDITKTPADQAPDNKPITNDNTDITEEGSDITKGKERKGNESKGKESMIAADAPIMNPFQLFEHEGFGTIGSTVADTLNVLIDDYGETRVCGAMREAVKYGGKNLAYVSKILSNPNSGKTGKKQELDWANIK